MCEALIAITDRLPSSDPNYALNYLALDIIVVCDDGWAWSEAELTNPDWRVLKVPGVSTSYAAQFSATRIDQVTGRLTRLRDWCFDSAQVPTAVMTYLANHQVITLTAAQASTAMTWVRKHSTTLSAS